MYLCLLDTENHAAPLRLLIKSISTVSSCCRCIRTFKFAGVSLLQENANCNAKRIGKPRIIFQFLRPTKCRSHESAPQNSLESFLDVSIKNFGDENSLNYSDFCCYLKGNREKKRLFIVTKSLKIRRYYFVVYAVISSTAASGAFFLTEAIPFSIAELPE